MLQSTTFLAQTKAAFTRFSFSSICCLLAFIIIAGDVLPDGKGRYFGILFLGCYLFISLQLIAERSGWTLAKPYIVGLPILFAIAWLALTDIHFATTFMFLSPALLLSIFIAPYVLKGAHEEHMCNFIHRLLVHICFALLASIILWIGFTAIISGAGFLFEFKAGKEVYQISWQLVALVFGPFLALTGIPKHFEEDGECVHTGARFILLYILMPLFIAYTMLLYGYMVKIAVLGTLPKGGVAYMVCAFGVVGMGLWIASSPLRQTHRMVYWFHRLFFVALLVPIALLALAIIQRVADYGITERRYAILLCLLWLTLSAIVGLFCSRSFALRITAISVVVLLALASFGPWGAENVSTNSQVARLKTLLETHGLLADERIQVVEDETQLSRQTRKDINEMVEYLSNSKKISALQIWFSDLPDAQVHKAAKNKRYRIRPNEVMADMGLQYMSRYDRRRNVNEKRFHYARRRIGNDVVETAGYDYLLRTGSMRALNTKQNSTILHLPNGGAIKVRLLEDQDISVTIKDQPPIKFKTEDLLAPLDFIKPATDRVNKVSLESLVETDSFSIKLIVEELNGKIPTDGTGGITINSMRLILLLKTM